MNLPIRVRLTLWYAVLLATIIASLGTFLVLQLRSDLQMAIDEEARTASASIRQALADESQEDDDDAAGFLADAEDFRDEAAASLPPLSGAQVISDDGRVLAVFGSVGGTRPLVDREAQAWALAGGSETLNIRLAGSGQPYRVLATELRDQDQAHVLVVALSLQTVEDAVTEVLLLLLVAGPVAIAATSFAAYWLARKALRPVERMTSDAQEIGAGRLHERVAVPPSRDEIGRLGVTLNAMLDRIERGVTDRHRLVADASHELRTPLAVMRAELDVSLRGDVLPPEAREVLESAREEVDRMSRTVDNMLALAAADEGRLELLTVQVSLRQAIEDAARPLRRLAAAKEITLLAEGGRLEAQADPQRLHLALTNLIENAIKFTPAGGSVRVTSWRREDEVGVTVSDEGPGIPAEDRAHLFDRYYRVDSASVRTIGGSGLGLAICREVALAHGGRLWVDSEPGAGSAFFLALPSWRAVQTDDNRPALADENDDARTGDLAPKA